MSSPSKIHFLAISFIFLASIACSLPTLTSVLPAGLVNTPTPSLTPTSTASPTPTPSPTPQPAERVTLGDEAIFVGDYERAVEENQLALNAASDPETQSAALYGIGRAQYFNDDPTQAIQALTTLVENYSDSQFLPEAYFVLGECYYDLENYVQAAESYRRYLELKPGVLDAYVNELRGDALMAARDYDSAVEAYQAAADAPQLSDPNFTRIKMGRAYAAMDDHVNAVRQFMGVYEVTDNDYLKAQADLLAGYSYLELGLPEQAYARFQDAVGNYPLAYDSYSALVALVDAGVQVSELDRGLVDYYAQQYGVAIQAFDRYMQSNPDHDGTPLHYKAFSQIAMGSPELAIETWEILIANHNGDRFWADAWDEKAYTQWAYLDRYEEAAKTLLDFVELMPLAPEAPDFLFMAARVYERNEQLHDAADTWMRMIDEYPEAELSYRGMLLSAVTRYRLQQYDQALAGFQRALSLAVNPEDQAASYLWLGKLAERDGDVEEARALWTQAVQADPTGYYSERAREILNGETPLEGPEIYNLDYDLEQERRLAELWLRNTFELADNVDLSDLGSLTNDERIIRGNEFTELGLYSLAGLEFEDLRSEVASDPAANFRLLNHLVDIGFYRPAIFISRQILGLAGMDDFATFSAPSYFNHIRFGIYFSDLILPAAESEGLHPLFLYSVIRQESLFEAHAYSSAGAQGLMQVIPSTGQEIAGQLNWPDDYSDADLYRPIVSIRFGSHYLARQVDFFDGDLYASLAAYNGGPGNAYQWKELAGDDPDLFLETIRIQETRDYLLFISEFMHIYERLYGRDPGEVVQ